MRTILTKENKSMKNKIIETKEKTLKDKLPISSTTKSGKISFLYRAMSFIILSFILFVHTYLFNKGIPYNPIVLCLLSYTTILLFRKQKFEDIIFSSNFSLFFLLFLSISTLLNTMLNIDNGYLFLINSFYVFLFGAIWTLNSPSLNLMVLQNRFGKNNVISPSLYYIVAGLSVFGIGIFVTAAMYGTEAKGTEISNLFKILVKLGVVLLCFQGGNFFFAGLTNIVCFISGNNKNYDALTRKLPEIINTSIITSKSYRILILFCSIYIAVLLLRGYWQLGNQIFWLLPVTCFSLFLFYKLSLKKYDYEYTVGINNVELCVYTGLLILSAIGMYGFSQEHQLSYNFNGLLQNMFLWADYNSDFILSFNILLFTLLGILLSLNNVLNSINFYIRIHNLGYSPLHMAISHVFFLIFAIYAVYEGVYSKTISEMGTYVFLMLLLTFASQITFRFIGFYVKELQNNYLIKK